MTTSEPTAAEKQILRRFTLHRRNYLSLPPAGRRKIRPLMHFRISSIVFSSSNIITLSISISINRDCRF